MNKNILKLIAAMLLTLALHSCKDELYVPQKQSRMTLENAKEFYNSHFSQFIPAADWNAAYFQKNSMDSILKVPLAAELGHRQLVLVSSGTGKPVNSYVLQYYPDLSAYDGKEPSYDVLESKPYSGIILHFETNGNFVKGHVFAEGKVIRDVFINTDNTKPMTEEGESVDCSNPKGPWVQYCARMGNLGGVVITGPRNPGSGPGMPVPGPTVPGGQPGGSAPNVKNFGIDPNCKNCLIEASKFASFLDQVKQAYGLASVVLPNVTITQPDGVQFTAEVTELYNSANELVISYIRVYEEVNGLSPNYYYSNGNKGADGTANPNKTPPVLVGSDGTLMPFTLPIVISTYNSYYSINEMTEIINTLSDPVTGEGIELYLVLQYRGSKMINMSYSRSEFTEVGSYTLTANYDRPKGGNLLFYTASRLGHGGSLHGPEFIIRADQLNAFRSHIDYYTKAADLVYMQGMPSKGMVQMMAGDRVSGLLNMWGDALKSPEY